MKPDDQLDIAHLEREERLGTFWMVFAAVSSAVVFVLVLITVANLGAFSPSAPISSSGSLYNLLNRDNPPERGYQWSQIYPTQLGEWVRIDYDPSSGRAGYRLGNPEQSREVRVQMGILTNAPAAQAEASRLRSEARGEVIREDFIDARFNFNYTLRRLEGEVRLIYHRSFWLYDIRATDQNALDEFMKVFPH
ncbi:MAG: hypothetical protein OHK0023_05520 [Anaerolineae bacterium]